MSLTSSSRRLCLQTALISLGAWALSSPASAQSRPAPAVLPPAQSLQDELAAALRQGQPLLVMASLEGCVYCRIARQSHLAPMQRAGQPIVQVDLRSNASVRDFAGKTTTHDELARRWNVTITPTLLFFGPGGREVAERMEGAYQPDFYGPYLQERLAQSRQRL
jgi:thioredoxin-related protein